MRNVIIDYNISKHNYDNDDNYGNVNNVRNGRSVRFLLRCKQMQRLPHMCYSV